MFIETKKGLLSITELNAIDWQKATSALRGKVPEII
jgi:hypothetical protein